MRGSTSVARMAVALLSISTVPTALAAWPRWLPPLDSLVVRDDSESTTNSASASKPTPFSTNLNTAGISKTDSASDATQTGDSGSSTSGTSFPTATGKGNSTNKHTTTFDPTNPPGGVVMTKPAITDPSQFYKIKDYVTLGWNYTNLLAAPTAIDVVLTVATPAATWTLTTNMTFESQASFTWDTQAYQTEHPAQLLPMTEVTLVIYDAESNPTAAAEPGYLAPFSGYKFGLYYPKEPVDLKDWVCATCSGAMSSLERKGLGAAVIMCLATVFSFTWFVTGFGVLAL